jgi:mannose-6-phosphate isomerase-like protein (cupin superfamily)
MRNESRDRVAPLLASAAVACTVLALVATPDVSAQTTNAAPAPAPAVMVSEADWMATMSRSAANNTLDTKVAETAVKGGVVRVGVIYRSRPETRALVHQELTEIYMIVKGSGTLVTGGTATDSQPVSDPPNLGLTPNFFVTQVGGQVRRVAPGDIIVIPAGLPHRLSEIDGPMSYTIYRFEPTQPR